MEKIQNVNIPQMNELQDSAIFLQDSSILLFDFWDGIISHGKQPHVTFYENTLPSLGNLLQLCLLIFKKSDTLPPSVLGSSEPLLFQLLQIVTFRLSKIQCIAL